MTSSATSLTAWASPMRSTATGTNAPRWPEDLAGKWVVTNTTTAENVEMLRARGVRLVITTTPRYEGRSFGTNALEAALTAYAGKGRPLSQEELSGLIEELDLRPTVEWLNR